MIFFKNSFIFLRKNLLYLSFTYIFAQKISQNHKNHIFFDKK